MIFGLKDLSLMALWKFLYNVGLAIVVLIAGYIISSLVGKIVTGIIKKFKIDNYLKKYGREDAFGGLTFSYICGQLVKWALFAGFISSSAQIINLDSIASILMIVSSGIITLLYAIIIVLVGFLIADFFADKVKEMKDLPEKEYISKIVRGIIIIATLDIAIKTVGVNVSFIENLIIILVGSFALGTAIALGIAFGLGGKEEAKHILEGLKTKVKKRKEKKE